MKPLKVKDGVFALTTKQVRVLSICDTKNIVGIFKTLKKHIGDHGYVAVIIKEFKKLNLVTKTRTGREVVVNLTDKGKQLVQLHKQINELMRR